MNKSVFCCSLLLFVVCVCQFPIALSFEYSYELLNGQLIRAKVEHHLARFNQDSYDVSTRLISMDAIRTLMQRDRNVDLYKYGVDSHLCTADLVQPAGCSNCVSASVVRNWLMQYIGKSILLVLRGPIDNCAATSSCLSCTFQKKSQNAYSLNATALVIGNTPTATDRVCLMDTDKDASSSPVVPTVLIFNSDYSTVNDALKSLASTKSAPLNAWGEVSDDSSNYAVSPAACATEETPFVFLVIQTGIIPVGVIATIFLLKSKLLPQAEEAARQQQNQQSANNNNNNQNQQQQRANQNGQQDQQAQNNDPTTAAASTAAAAASSGDAAAAAVAQPASADAHRISIPSSSSSSLEESSSNSFGPASTPGSAIAIADGVELDEFHSSSSRTRSLPSSTIDEQALLSSDALASDSAGSTVSRVGGSGNRSQMDLEEDFNRRSLIDSHRRLYAVLDFILGFGSPKSLFYGTLMYNLILLMIIEIILVNARDEVCYATDLKWILVYRAGLCFAAVFHAFGQSFSNIPSVMRLFFYSRAAGIFFSLMFFTTCVSFLVIRRTDADAYPNQPPYDCDARAPLLSSTILPFFMLFLAGGALLILMRFVDQAYAACTQGRTTVAPAYEGLLVLFGRAIRKHFLSGCVLFGPLDQAEPVTTLQLSLLPTTTFHVGMYPQEDAVCAICLGNYEAGERLRVLPCHHFHSACLDQWITSQKPTCPTCRRSIPLSYQQYEEANQHDPHAASDHNVRRDGTQRRDGRMAVPVEDI